MSGAPAIATARLTRIDVYRAAGYGMGAEDEVTEDVIPRAEYPARLRASDGELTTDQAFTITVLGDVPAAGDSDLLLYCEDAPEIRYQLGAPHRLELSIFAVSAWATILRSRMRLVTRYSDGSYLMWRIQRVRASADGSQPVSVSATPISDDLGDTYVRYHRAAGVSRSLPLRNITLAHAAETILADGYGSPAVFTLGTVDSALAPARVDLDVNLTTHLAALQSICEQAGAEWTERHGGGAVYIDIVRHVGWDEDEIASGVPDVNSRLIEGPSRLAHHAARRTLTQDDDAEGYFSRVIPYAVDGQDRVGIRGLWWPVTSGGSPAGGQTTFGLRHESGSGADHLILPFWAPGTHAGRSLLFEDLTYNEILSADLDGNITIAGSRTVSVGHHVRIIEVVEGPRTGTLTSDVRYTEVDYAHDPQHEATRGTAEVPIELPHIAPVDNLFAAAGSADLSTTDGIEAFGGASITQTTDGRYVQYGSAAALVSGDAGAGIRTVDIPITHRRSPLVSAWMSIRALSGSATMRIIDTSTGKAYPPATDSQIHIGSGDDADLAAAIGGVEIEGGAFRIEVVFLEADTEVVIDAITATNSHGAYAYSAEMGPRAMYEAAVRHLVEEGGGRPLRYEVEAYDVTQYDPDAEGAREIRVGSWVRIRDFYDAETGAYLVDRSARVESMIVREDRVQGRVEKRITVGSRRKNFYDRFLRRVPPPRKGTVPPQPGEIEIPDAEQPVRPSFFVTSRYENGGTVFTLHAASDGVADRIHYELLVMGSIVASGSADFTSPGSVGALVLMPAPGPGEPLVLRPVGASAPGPTPPAGALVLRPAPAEGEPLVLYPQDGQGGGDGGGDGAPADGALSITLNAGQPVQMGQFVQVRAWGEETASGRLQDPKWRLDASDLILAAPVEGGPERPVEFNVYMSDETATTITFWYHVGFRDEAQQGDIAIEDHGNPILEDDFTGSIQGEVTIDKYPSSANAITIRVTSDGVLVARYSRYVPLAALPRPSVSVQPVAGPHGTTFRASAARDDYSLAVEWELLIEGIEVASGTEAFGASDYIEWTVNPANPAVYGDSVQLYTRGIGPDDLEGADRLHDLGAMLSPPAVIALDAEPVGEYNPLSVTFSWRALVSTSGVEMTVSGSDDANPLFSQDFFGQAEGQVVVDRFPAPSANYLDLVVTVKGETTPIASLRRWVDPGPEM